MMICCDFKWVFAIHGDDFLGSSFNECRAFLGEFSASPRLTVTGGSEGKPSKIQPVLVRKRGS
jgi:hypothetical protein